MHYGSLVDFENEQMSRSKAVFPTFSFASKALVLIHRPYHLPRLFSINVKATAI